jgi:single-stranded-DNA-specific exonuclease
MVDAVLPSSAPSATSAPVESERPRAAPEPAGPEALALARQLGSSVTFADLLHRRGRVDGEELGRWLDPKLAHLTPPEGMADLGAAAERIGRAIRRAEPICVFGDYDCDGITATTIVTEVIEALGGQATPLLASRFAGGYGFSPPALERVKATGATLLVTCDCGSSDHERLAAARLSGIEAVVIDHHLVPEEPLPALAFLNPHRPDCAFPYQGLASCGLALILATSLRKTLDAKLDLRRWLDLVAVGTIADVAPLDGDNRLLVRAGLGRLACGQRVGLDALALAGSGGRRRPLSAEDVAYQVAPRINAPGRLGDPRVALELLRERDQARARLLAERIERMTVERRDIQRTMTAEALQEVSARGWASDPALVLARQGWHPGVVGIVAGRLSQQLGKPCVVIALEGTTGRGSARAPAGFRLHDALSASADPLLGFGGHQAAAGVELGADRVEAFRDAFRAACARQIAERPLSPPGIRAEVRLDERDDLAAVLVDLERLEPCGHGNPAPRLFIGDVQVLEARDVKGHLKLDLRWDGRRLGAFAPEQGAKAAAVVGSGVDLLGRLKRDHWRGGDLPEILVDEILTRPQTGERQA